MLVFICHNEENFLTSHLINVMPTLLLVKNVALHKNTAADRPVQNTNVSLFNPCCSITLRQSITYATVSQDDSILSQIYQTLNA